MRKAWRVFGLGSTLIKFDETCDMDEGCIYAYVVNINLSKERKASSISTRGSTPPKAFFVPHDCIHDPQKRGLAWFVILVCDHNRYNFKGSQVINTHRKRFLGFLWFSMH